MVGMAWCIEEHCVIPYIDDAIVGDGHTVGVTTQVLQDLLRLIGDN